MIDHPKIQKQLIQTTLRPKNQTLKLQRMKIFYHQVKRLPQKRLSLTNLNAKTCIINNK
jgi:hypothetical protein